VSASCSRRHWRHHGGVRRGQRLAVLRYVVGWWWVGGGHPAIIDRRDLVTFSLSNPAGGGEERRWTNEPAAICHAGRRRSPFGWCSCGSGRRCEARQRDLQDARSHPAAPMRRLARFRISARWGRPGSRLLTSEVEGGELSFAGRFSSPLFIPQIAACVRFWTRILRRIALNGPSRSPRRYRSFALCFCWSRHRSGSAGLILPAGKAAARSCALA
jgi:hypothetical protein